MPVTLRGQRVHSLFCLYIYYNFSSDKLVNNIHMLIILYLLITFLFDIVVISVLEKSLIDHSSVKGCIQNDCNVVNNNLQNCPSSVSEICCICLLLSGLVSQRI